MFHYVIILQLMKVDEIEALSAIYGEDWHVINDSSHVFGIKVSDVSKNEHRSLMLQVCMQFHYIYILICMSFMEIAYNSL